MNDRFLLRTFRAWLGPALAVAGLAAAASPLIDEHLTVQTVLAAFAMGLTSTFALLGIERLVKRGPASRLPLWATFVLSIFLDVAALGAIQMAMALVFGLNSDRSGLAEMVMRNDFQRGLAALAVLILTVQFLLMIQTILGKGVLSRLLLGTYRHPREVDRFFLFLDLRDSTRISEALARTALPAGLRIKRTYRGRLRGREEETVCHSLEAAAG